MNTKILSGVIVVLVVVLALVWFKDTPPKEPATTKDAVNTGPETASPSTSTSTPSEVEKVFSRLPRTVTVGQRVAVIDRSTVPSTPKSEYSFREAGTLPLANQDPIDYIEKILKNRIGKIPTDEPIRFATYAASFHPLGDNGVTAFVRISNMSDDSVGASEDRFDLIFRNGKWELDWYGQRNLCQRPGQTYWTPADKLCP